MILVDSTVWIGHLRTSDLELQTLLEAQKVSSHPFVIGELAMGDLKDRDDVIQDLDDLPKTLIATDDEVQGFIKQYSLFGLGIGYIDAHLLAAVQLAPDALLWTRDKHLRAAAERLHLAARTIH